MASLDRTDAGIREMVSHEIQKGIGRAKGFQGRPYRVHVIR